MIDYGPGMLRSGSGQERVEPGHNCLHLPCVADPRAGCSASSTLTSAGPSPAGQADRWRAGTLLSCNQVEGYSCNKDGSCDAFLIHVQHLQRQHRSDRKKEL